MATTLAELIVFFKGDDKDLVSDLDKSKKQTESFAANAGNLIKNAFLGAGAVAGSAILAIGGKAFSVAQDIDKATDQIGASLGLTADDAKAFGDVIKQVYGDNWGDSIEDVGTAVETVAKQLRLTADDPALSQMTQNAFRLRDVFGVDVKDSIDAVKTLTENFGISSQEAFDMITRGYQSGIDRSGDFLDTIGEYSTQFAAGGAEVSEFFSILEDGLGGGMLGTDKAADLFKEFRVRIQDGSTLTADSLTMIGINADEMAAKLADGSLSAMDAFKEVQNAIQHTEDKTVQFQAGVGLLGTQFEDLGKLGPKALETMSDSFYKVEGATESLDAKYTSLGSVAEGMWRKFYVGIAPAGEAILAMVNENLPAIQGLVETVSAKVVEFINLIPPAIKGVREKWDEDWGGIRSTWDTFRTEAPQQHEEFWAEWNRIFGENTTQATINWEGFLTSWNTIAKRLQEQNHLQHMTWLQALDGEVKLWSAVIQGDWQAAWDAMKQITNAVTDVILNDIEMIWGPELRNKIVGALYDAWDGMKDIWEDIKGWWDSTFGWLFGQTGQGSSITPNLGIVNPQNLPGWQPSVNNAVGGLNYGYDNSGFFGNSFPQGEASTTINVYPQYGSYNEGLSTGDGIVDAMRFRGQ